MLFKFLSKYFNRRVVTALLIPIICLIWLLNAPDPKATSKTKEASKTKDNTTEKIAEAKKEEEPENVAVEGLQLDFDNDNEEKKVAPKTPPKKNITVASTAPKKSKAIKMYGSLNNVLSASMSQKVASSSSKKVKLIKSTLENPKTKTTKPAQKKVEPKKDITAKEEKPTEEKSVLSFNPEESSSRFLNVTNNTQEVLNSIKKNNKKSVAPMAVAEHVNSDILLRKKANKQNKEVTIDKELNDKLAMTWVPKYLKNKITTTSKVGAVPTSKNTAANQIELIDLIENNVAVIKNTSNNMIEYLRSGDKYNGLKLEQINKKTVILSDVSDGKRYIKILDK